MPTETFYTLLTAVGKAKLANAQANGTAVAFTTIKAGDGGGAYYSPSESQTALVNTVWTGLINSIYIDPNNSTYVVVEAVIPAEVGDFYIREVGIFDDAGALICIGKYPETYKPTLAQGSGKDLYLRCIMETSNAAQVTLKIDPSIVLATKKDIVLHNDDAAAHSAFRQKLILKDAVRVATTAEISLSGAQTIDGVAVVAGDAVLVKDQSTTSVNGIYVASTGAWTRRSDADTAAKLVARMMVPVKEGTANGGTLWWLTTIGSITLEVTGLVFEEPFARRAGNATQIFRVATAVGASDATPLAQVQSLLSESEQAFVAAGTADAITGDLDPAIPAYYSGLRVSTTPPGQNQTTNPTVDLCSLGPVTAKKMGSNGGKVALDLGDWSGAGPAILEHDGVDFILINPIIDVAGVARSYTAAQRGAVKPLVDGATITPDFKAANNFALVLGGNRTLANPSNLVAGQSGMIDIFQDATGSRTLAYAWGWSWPWGVIASLSTAPLTRDQLAYYVSDYAQSVVTISLATPGVVSWPNHNLKSGQKVQFTTTGALYTGLAVGTTYYVNVIDANSFSVSATLGGAAIATSGSESGVHTCTAISILAAMSKGVV